jgi:hypothetical protein
MCFVVLFNQLLIYKRLFWSSLHHLIKPLSSIGFGNTPSLVQLATLKGGIVKNQYPDKDQENENSRQRLFLNALLRGLPKAGCVHFLKAKHVVR